MACVITIVNYDPKSFIVQATGVNILQFFVVYLLTLFLSYIFSEHFFIFCSRFQITRPKFLKFKRDKNAAEIFWIGINESK